MNQLAAFNDKWGRPKNPPTPVDPAALMQVGLQLGMTFPACYIAAMGEVGAPSTTLGLLHVITTQQLDLPDLSALHVPADVWTKTVGWRAAGMPNWLVAIGSDCMGNSFCFDMRKKGILRKSSPAIYLWDHDLGNTRKVADSFDLWIERYLQLSGNYDSWKDDDAEGKTPAASTTGVS
jgi:hypothetical protein